MGAYNTKWEKYINRHPRNTEEKNLTYSTNLLRTVLERWFELNSKRLGKPFPWNERGWPSFYMYLLSKLIRTTHQQGWEMTQRSKGLPCKHENLSLECRDPCKMPGGLHTSLTVVVGSYIGRIQPSLANQWLQTVREVWKKKERERKEKTPAINLWPPHTHRKEKGKRKTQ